jgi:hypothetical protein
MRTISLLAILPLLVTTFARPNRQTRDHREIMENQARSGPSPSEAQWLTFDDTPSTTSIPAYIPLPTAIPIANKSAVKGSGCKANQAQAVNFVQKHPNVVSYIQKKPDQPPQTQSEGVVSQAEMNEWLRVHDIARSQHGAGRLRWNETLAIGAKGNAIQCRGEHTYVDRLREMLIGVVLGMERTSIPTRFSFHPRKPLMLGWRMLVSPPYHRAQKLTIRILQWDIPR